MGKNEIIKSVSEKTGVAKTDCEKVVDAFAETITDYLVAGEKVLLKGFMSFEVAERGERKGRNPKTGEVVTFPASKSVKCKVAKTIKDLVNNS